MVMAFPEPLASMVSATPVALNISPPARLAVIELPVKATLELSRRLRTPALWNVTVSTAGVPAAVSPLSPIHTLTALPATVTFSPAPIKPEDVASGKTGGDVVAGDVDARIGQLVQRSARSEADFVYVGARSIAADVQNIPRAGSRDGQPIPVRVSVSDEARLTEMASPHRRDVRARQFGQRTAGDDKIDCVDLPLADWPLSPIQMASPEPLPVLTASPEP